jgi:glycosyltransferase involved in cell wall biosynthesis
LPQTLSTWAEASRLPVETKARAARFIFLTPLMSGTDGISEMPRQWVRVVESRAGLDAHAVEVWSLDDYTRPSVLDAASTFRGGGGGRFRFASFGVMDGASSAEDTVVVVMHLQLLPVALPLVLRGARLVTVLMGIEAWTPLNHLQKAAMRRAWRVIAISTHTAVRFRVANPWIGEMPITVCHPGVPPLPRVTAAPFDGRYALIVARMDVRERYKGHDTLIELWPAVRRTVADAQLIVVGDGDDAARLRQKAADTCEGITFLGRVDEVTLAALYRDATFFVMPSPDEGFGLVYLEAMRASTPCIAVHGAAEEIITDGHDGLIVDAGDDDELLAAIVHLFADKQARMRMGAAAARLVNTQFDAAALRRRVCAALGLGHV